VVSCGCIGYKPCSCVGHTSCGCVGYTAPRSGGGRAGCRCAPVS
jgi:hypothetical protein